MWGGESELCQVMLANTVISFIHKDSLFLLTVVTLGFMHVCIRLQVFLSWTIPMTV